MKSEMIVAGVINNLVGTIFTLAMILIVFAGRKVWLKYGPKQKAVVRTVVRSKYTCPHCGTTAVVNPVYEELS